VIATFLLWWLTRVARWILAVLDVNK
jgi:hypothetical protein